MTLPSPVLVESARTNEVGILTPDEWNFMVTAFNDHPWGVRSITIDRLHVIYVHQGGRVLFANGCGTPKLAIKDSQ